MTCGIYKLTSPSGKGYVGQSVCIRKRFSKYKRLDCEDQPKLYNALKKYGVENFKYDILEECNRAELNTKEEHYINLFNTVENGYNCRIYKYIAGRYNGHQNIEFYIDSILYKSLGEASELLDIPIKTIHHRLTSSNIKFSNYQYKDKERIPVRRPRKNPRKIEFYIDGQLFNSLKSASKKLGINHYTIHSRLNSETTNFSNYYYKDESKNRKRREPKRQLAP
jgi:hypothetical protein